MNCRQALELFDSHLEMRLTPFQRWRLRLHLWICRHCRRYLTSYKMTVRAEKAALQIESYAAINEIPEELVKSIVKLAENRGAVRGPEFGKTD